jgi:hypothetical protein
MGLKFLFGGGLEDNPGLFRPALGVTVRKRVGRKSVDGYQPSQENQMGAPGEDD